MFYNKIIKFSNNKLNKKMGNINCCNKPSEEKVLETFEEENKNDNDSFPFDSTPNYQNEQVKEINEINGNSNNIYEIKDIVKEGNTYNVEVNYLNKMNDQMISDNENEGENIGQNLYKQQPINEYDNYNQIEKEYKNKDNNFNDNNIDINHEQEVEEGDFNKIGENQNDLVKSPILYSLGFQSQQILENSDINSFGLRNSNNYNLSPSLKNDENAMNNLEQNDLQKRVIDLSQSAYNNNNQIELNNIDIENSNVNSGVNYLNNIDIFNSAFTFGGSQQNNRNNMTGSNIILGQSLNSNNSLNFHNSDIMIN